MRSFIQAHTVALFGLFFALLLGSCADMAPDSKGSSYCANDLDCGGNYVCVYGACYDPASASLQQLAFEIIPDNASQFPAQQIQNFVISAQERSDLWLSPSIEAYFSLRATGNIPVAGIMTATTLQHIPGRPQSVTARAGSDGNLHIVLEQGLSYRLRFLPNDPVQIPFVPDAIFANQDIAGREHLSTLILPGPDLQRQVSGRIITSQSRPTPIPDLQVQLRGLVGNPPEWEVVSNTALTSSTRDGASDSVGHFQLRVPQSSSAGLQLHITPSEHNPFVPVIDINNINLSGDLDLGDVEIGEIGSPISVSGTVHGPRGAVTGAQVNFIGQVGKGQFRAASLTDDQGLYQIMLLPGLYQAAVQAPTTAQAALVTSSEAIQIDTAPRGTSLVDFTAPAKAQISGQLSNAKGQALSGQLIRASRIGDIEPSDNSPSATLYSQVEVRSDADGYYAMQLDSGLYQLDVIPDADSLLPRRSDVLAVGSLDIVRDIDLFAAAPFGARLVSENQAQAVPNALVRAFLLLDDEQSLLIGEQVSDANGEFAMVLPRFLTDE